LTKPLQRSIFNLEEIDMNTTPELTAWDFSSEQLPYYNQLYKTALRMTRSVPETEDLLQETYLKAYRYYKGFEEGTNLKAWLFRIMKNNFADADPEIGAVAEEMDPDVARAINALSHDYKMALLLVDIQGHSYHEVAQMLAVPVGTVMSRLYRARTKIEKALITFGKENNYLTRAPRKVRDNGIDLESLFGAPSAV
jgi:RNA polymerase sigma-70 factor (ECF subfamily)